MDALSLDTSLPPPPSITTSSTRPSPTASLTTFPNAFQDEPEPGLLPALFSKVKSTFASSPLAQTPATSAPKVDKGVSVLPAEPQRQASAPGQPTEAQAIAEAERRRNARRQSLGPAPLPSSSPPTITIPEEAVPSRPSPVQTSNSHTKSLKVPGAQSASSSITTPSIAPSTAPSKRLVPPGERQWRPSGAAPAQVTISPVTSVTTTVQATKSISTLPEEHSTPGPPRARAHFAPSPINTYRSSSALNPAVRLRRSSIATIPDSPSSISLSAMIAANAELSQNASYVPGFPLPADDTRSVKSVGFVKKSNSVSRLIRRMRGEGLSKHYWMADEHCKECYDCKSVRLRVKIPGNKN